MLKQLKYFQSVVEKKQLFRGGGRKFHFSVGRFQQIQALERELGFKLLERKTADLL